MIEVIHRHIERARAAVPLLQAAGLDAVWVEEDVVEATDGRGVRVRMSVRRLQGVVEAVWRVLDRVSP